MTTATRPALVLFDFDGTLADTAPDLAAAANAVRLERGLTALPEAELRPQASHGARGLLGVALGLAPGDDGFELARDRFLAHYAEGMFARPVLFDGVPELLATLEAQGVAWGIVTNKVERLARPLVEHLQLRPATLVCGDTTPTPKPHPAPLLLAAREAGFAPAQSHYVGDDLRDIQAGIAAGMGTIAAGWGYIGTATPVTAWGADLIADTPNALLPYWQLS